MYLSEDKANLKPLLRSDLVIEFMNSPIHVKLYGLSKSYTDPTPLFSSTWTYRAISQIFSKSHGFFLTHLIYFTYFTAVN